MKKLLLSSAGLLLANIVGFYVLKDYNDNRQVRVASACSAATVELAGIAPIIETKTVQLPIGKHEIFITTVKHRVGFGMVNRGTGVLVSNDGLIMTAYHVARHSPLMRVSLNGLESEDNAPRVIRKQRRLFAYLVGYDKDADIALLRVFYPGQRFRYAALRKSVKKGLPVITVGFPIKFVKHVTAGVVSSFSDGMTYTDVVIEHGSSGGGLFDLDGRLVGIASFMWYPSGSPVYAAGFTSLDAMHKLLEKYEDF
jgi:S1-C subfamily serine protease